MLKEFLVSQKLCFMPFHIILIFFGVFIAGTTVYNIGNTLSIARGDTFESPSPIKLVQQYQSKMALISNLVEPSIFKISSDNPTIGSASNNSLTTTADNSESESEFRQDITGKYANPKYGITEFEIPMGWFATESMNGDKGIILTILPGTTEEFFTRLNSLPNNETLPIMNLVVQDKENLREQQMSSSLSEPSSFSTSCTELTSNSTSTINDKQFHISTMKCSTTDKAPIAEGIDFDHDEITKSYKYDSPSTMYVLQLVLSSEYSSNKMVNDAYLSKFQPVIEDAIQTLKIR
ncbi:MAG TPA: hypothetical protein VJR94_06745 [Candidatus Nitrosocosmicus sp.]|nr:hypothetical protein [Candidatus Nitrosocosmicus sp.]